MIFHNNWKPVWWWLITVQLINRTSEISTFSKESKMFIIQEKIPWLSKNFHQLWLRIVSSEQFSSPTMEPNQWLEKISISKSSMKKNEKRIYRLAHIDQRWDSSQDQNFKSTVKKIKTGHKKGGLEKQRVRISKHKLINS